MAMVGWSWVGDRPANPRNQYSMKGEIMPDDKSLLFTLMYPHLLIIDVINNIYSNKYFLNQLILEKSLKISIINQSDFWIFFDYYGGI